MRTVIRQLMKNDNQWRKIYSYSASPEDSTKTDEDTSLLLRSYVYSLPPTVTLVRFFKHWQIMKPDTETDGDITIVALQAWAVYYGIGRQYMN